MTDSPISYKRCPKCKEVKTTKEFSTNKTRNDGLSVHCKVCHREYQKIVRERNKIKIQMYDRAQKVLEQKRLAKEYAEKHPNGT